MSKLPAIEQAQFLGLSLTGSLDTGKDPSTPLMGTSYTYNNDNALVKNSKSNQGKFYEDAESLSS